MAKASKQDGKAGAKKIFAQPNHDRLPEFIERVERLETEKADVQEEIKSVFLEAKEQNIDVKAMKEMIKLRKKDKDERDYDEAVREAYKARLGMLGDYGLGEAAIRRFEEERKQRRNSGDADQSPFGDDKKNGEDTTPGTGANEGDPFGLPPTGHSDTRELAREKGHAAGAAGQSLRTNPYQAFDPCRAAWDEGWVAGSGQTGMEVQSAWKRPEKKKKDDGQDGDPDGGETGIEDATAKKAGATGNGDDDDDDNFENDEKGDAG